MALKPFCLLPSIHINILVQSFSLCRCRCISSNTTPSFENNWRKTEEDDDRCGCRKLVCGQEFRKENAETAWSLSNDAQQLLEELLAFTDDLKPSSAPSALALTSFSHSLTLVTISMPLKRDRAPFWAGEGSSFLSRSGFLSAGLTCCVWLGSRWSSSSPSSLVSSSAEHLWGRSPPTGGDGGSCAGATPADWWGFRFVSLAESAGKKLSEKEATLGGWLLFAASSLVTCREPPIRASNCRRIWNKNKNKPKQLI